MISEELALLHRLVVQDLICIAHHRTQGSVIGYEVRQDIFTLTGFPQLGVEDAEAGSAQKLLDGPFYRMLRRPTRDVSFPADLAFSGPRRSALRFRAGAMWILESWYWRTVKFGL